VGLLNLAAGRLWCWQGERLEAKAILFLKSECSVQSWERFNIFWFFLLLALCQFGIYMEAIVRGSGVASLEPGKLQFCYHLLHLSSGRYEIEVILIQNTSKTVWTQHSWQCFFSKEYLRKMSVVLISLYCFWKMFLENLFHYASCSVMWNGRSFSRHFGDRMGKVTAWETSKVTGPAFHCVVSLLWPCRKADSLIGVHNGGKKSR